MSKVKVTCDSTCDLTAEQYAQFNIQPLALGITLGEQVYADGVNITVSDAFAYADRTGTLPKTSAVTPLGYEEAFRRYTEAGYEVVHINLCSDMSSCYQNACIAAAEVGNVYPIDSRNLSTGSGHLAIMAAELAEQGLSGQEIADILNEKKELLDVSFVLQQLDYLRMGGRCSGVSAMGAALLKIKPVICVRDGVMVVGRKHRGDLRRTIFDYVRGRLEGRTDIDTKRIFVTHCQLDDALVQEIVALVKELQPFEEVLISQAGCTIASHCGPLCMGVLFFRKPE